MKKAFAVAVVATIAATTTEGANLRANPTKTEQNGKFRTKETRFPNGAII